MSEQVWVTEVGPRDGLQNERADVPTEAKIAFVDALVRAGVKQIEVTSFVHPRRVPGMADAEAVMAGRVRVGRGGLVVGCGVAVALAGGCGVAVAGDWLAMVVPAGGGLTARLRAMNQVPLASNRMIPQMRREASRIMGRDGPAATDVGGAVCWGSWKPQLPQKAAFGLAG